MSIDLPGISFRELPSLEEAAAGAAEGGQGKDGSEKLTPGKSGLGLDDILKIIMGALSGGNVEAVGSFSLGCCVSIGFTLAPYNIFEPNTRTALLELKVLSMNERDMRSTDLVI